MHNLKQLDTLAGEVARACATAMETPPAKKAREDNTPWSPAGTAAEASPGSLGEAAQAAAGSGRANIRNSSTNPAEYRQLLGDPTNECFLAPFS